MSRRKYDGEIPRDMLRRATEIAIDHGGYARTSLYCGGPRETCGLGVGYGRSCAVIDEVVQFGIVEKKLTRNKGYKVLISSIKEFDKLVPKEKKGWPWSRKKS